MFSFGLSSVVSKVFVVTLTMCLFTRKDIAQNYCCSNPKIPFPAYKYVFKVNGRNPKS